MSCGEAHAVALCASGEVVTWGCGIHGEAAAEAVVYSVRPQLVPLLGVLREKEAVRSVRAGGHRSVVVTSQNRLLSWGEGDHERPDVLVSTLEASDMVTDLAVETAALFLVDYDVVDVPVRFDVVSIVVVPPDRAFIRHHIGAFSAG